MGAELFLALFSSVVLLPALALLVWGAILDGRGDDEPTLVAVREDTPLRSTHVARNRGDS